MQNRNVILNQLQPFNEARFDACMAYLGQKMSADLTQYEMVKLHVVIDLIHTAFHGQPVIGGRLEAWQYGPVIDSAYNRVKRWGHRFDKYGTQPEQFDIVSRDGNKLVLRPTCEIDPDEFSPAEIDAMERAWQLVKNEHVRWSSSQDFFHNPATPIGKVWCVARENDSPIDWRDFVRAWGDQFGSDVSNSIMIMTP